MIQLSINAKSRHHYSPKPKEDDLFYQIDGGRFRLYEPESDPAPIYGPIDDGPRPPQDEEPPSQFAYEADLRNYLAKNLGLLEPGLALYEEEGIKGIEFPAGGRFIDILALDSKNIFRCGLRTH